MIKAPISVRLKNSAHGIIKVLKRPHYILLAGLVAFLASGLVIWSLNFELVRYIIIDAPISVFEKIRFFWDVQTGIYSAYENMQASGIILFGLLFGLNTALLVYTIRSGSIKKIPKKSGGASVVFAALGGGCVACGTSILAPLLATLGATTSTFVTSLSHVLIWISILLISYSMYKLGAVINNTSNNA